MVSAAIVEFLESMRKGKQDKLRLIKFLRVIRIVYLVMEINSLNSLRQNMMDLGGRRIALLISAILSLRSEKNICNLVRSFFIRFLHHVSIYILCGADLLVS